MLDHLDDFVQALRRNAGRVLLSDWRGHPIIGARGEPAVEGDLFCSPCGGHRRMKIRPYTMPPEVYNILEQAGEFGENPRGRVSYEDPVEKKPVTAEALREALIPSLFVMNCVQCDASYTAIIHRGPGGASLAVLPSEAGGLKTKHTPTSVAYFLDQAQRSRSVGAFSAALAMYRAAMEQLLHEQGYTSGMLATKIGKLEQEIASQSAPRWASSHGGLNTSI